MKSITVTLTEEQFDLISHALVVGHCATDSLKADADYHQMKHSSGLYAKWQKETEEGKELFSRVTFDARLAARML